MSDGEAHSHVFIIFKFLAQHLRGNKVGGKARYYWVTKQKKHGKRSAPGLEHIHRSLSATPFHSSTYMHYIH